MFIQPDWFEVTQPGVGTNRYSYSFNDPINKMDPTGNAVWADRDGDGKNERIGSNREVFGDNHYNMSGREKRDVLREHRRNGYAGVGRDRNSVSYGVETTRGSKLFDDALRLCGRTCISPLKRVGNKFANKLRNGFDWVGRQFSSLFDRGATNPTLIGEKRAGKIQHLFGQSKHNFDPLVRQLGSQDRALTAIDKAAQAALKRGQLNMGTNGIHKSTTVQVGQFNVELSGGFVKNGVFEIGSAGIRF